MVFLYKIPRVTARLNAVDVHDRLFLPGGERSLAVQCLDRSQRRCLPRSHESHCPLPCGSRCEPTALFTPARPCRSWLRFLRADLQLSTRAPCTHVRRGWRRSEGGKLIRVVSPTATGRGSLFWVTLTCHPTAVASKYDARPPGRTRCDEGVVPFMVQPP